MIPAAFVIGVLAGIVAGWWLRQRRGVAAAVVPQGRRILLPFAGAAISKRALEAAMRLARAENATIMPTYLARVPLSLPLDAALPQQSQAAMPLLEAIEQRAAAGGLVVDARVARGRTYRDALQHILASEHVDRVIVSATVNPRLGLSARDLDWLLRSVPAEILILRPGLDDERTITAAGVAGHF